MARELHFPPRMTLARTPTPLERLERFQLPVRLWCKRDDLTGAELTGNKVRKLEFVLADAMERGCDTLITCGGLQSNHCRATAFAAARLGLKCHLVLRGDPQTPPDGNHLLSQMAGARTTVYPAEQYTRDLPHLLAKHRDEAYAAAQRPYVIPTGASDEVGVWGYVRAAAELAEDFKRAELVAPLVVCAAGSGGTLAGLALGLSVYAPEARVLGVAVCDSADYFHRRVREDIERCLARYPQQPLRLADNFEVVDDYIGPGYAKSYPEVYQTMAQAARRAGLILDPVYTAKAFYGMLDRIESRVIATGRDVVFVHTGGAFGVFAQRRELADWLHLPTQQDDT